MSDWTWQLVDSQGTTVEHALGGSVFPTQSEAESWLGEEWETLLEDGVDAVNLAEDGTFVYGPMSLHPAE